ncbi:right-handed parallel beta-helix repeat-containing protein [Streptomyces purpurogeneiscleroticus]|uniref:right-handed parallel beta-helix repeat-containing protein n=1 Tax=Streptomyces purpurogeneiscleroticus TaxID=68259 RepID=UPI001CBC1057|nr:right-handed parallel beta-helix repeat-containing protein [Streptomyces purpurogeneiscleroticus]
MSTMRRTAAHSAPARYAPGALTAAILVIAASGCSGTPHYSPPPTSHTYYVSPRGDDRDKGSSPGTAWRTLARAERVALHPGDRLLLKGGARFSGTITLKRGEAGDASRPVVIGSYGRGRATIKATGSPAVSVHNTAGVDIRNLTLIGKGTAYTRDTGIDLYSDLRNGRKLDHVTVSGIDVSRFQVGIAVGGGAGRTGFKDVTIRKARLHANKDAGLLTYGPTFDPRDPGYAHQNVDITDVRAYRNPGDPTANDRHTGNGIILGGVRDATVRHSSAHDNGKRAGAEAPAGPAGIWAYDATEVLLEHNTAYRNHTGSRVDGSGFGLDSSVSDATIQYNLSFHNDGPGFYAYSRHVNGAHTDNTIRYNISNNDGRKLPSHGGVAVHGTDIRKLAIYQNTVVMTASPNGIGPALQLERGETGVTVRNNLLVTDGSPLVAAEPGLDPRDVVLQGNNYRAPQGKWKVSWAGLAYYALPDWRAATSQETAGDRPTGLTARPCFTGGTLPDVRSAADARLLVPDCDALQGKGLDLRKRFDTAPGSTDYFGRTVGTPPPIGAARPAAD